MAEYRVMCVRYGFADIEADSEEEAIESAKSLFNADYDWSDPDEHQIMEEK